MTSIVWEVEGGLDPALPEFLFTLQPVLPCHASKLTFSNSQSKEDNDSTLESAGYPFFVPSFSDSSSTVPAISSSGSAAFLLSNTNPKRL